MQHIPGPDFPTAGIINGAQEIATAYRTGRGRLSIRARAHFEDIDGKGGRQAIIVTELPYQVNKARLLERIADLVRAKQIEGISELRDESDKDGMRVVIELKRGEVAEIVLNNLYAQTPMETVFGINMVALQDGQPKLLSLKEMLDAFIRHRREVVTRRTIYDLAKARERAHVLEGLAVALANIDAIIAVIKAAPAPAAARRSFAVTALARRRRAGAAGARGQRIDPPEYARRRFGPHRGGVSSVGGAGAGHPRHAPASPDGARAGQDRQRIPGSAGQHRRSERYSRPAGAADARWCVPSSSRYARTTAMRAAPRSAAITWT